MKRRIYEEVQGIYYSCIEQALSELCIPKYLVIHSLKRDTVVKYNNSIYRFSWID